MTQGAANTATVNETATGALGALDDTVTVALAGKSSVGFQIDAGTLNALAVVGELSFDGGATWSLADVLYKAFSGTFYALDFSINLTGGGIGIGVAAAGSILALGGATHARLRVAVYTAGTSNATVSATDIVPDVLGSVMTSAAGGSPSGKLPVTGTINVGNTPSVSVVSVTKTTSGDPVGVVVSNVAVLVLADNFFANSRIITNNGSSNIYLGKSNTVTASGATMGIKLAPGGSYSDSGFGMYTGDIYAIGDAVSVTENVSAWERL